MNNRIRQKACSGVFLCILVLSAGPFPASAALTESDFDAIDAYVEVQMRAVRIPGLALGIVQDNRIVHLRGFGISGPSGQPVTPQTPFIIGSVSKSFTAMAVMQLMEEGKIELDAPVQRYIPWFCVAGPDASARIAVRHLLNHTSGIPNSAGLWSLAGTGDITLEQSVREMSDVALAHPIGTTFEYSNANYLVLGLIVQSVSGASYEEYVRQHIFVPLEMRNSFVSQTEAMQNGMASGYRWWFGVPFPADVPYLHDAIPAGYIISSVEDMTHFLMANLNHGRYGDASVLSPSGVAELHRPAVKGAGEEYYGMGWVIGSTDGVPTLSHEGDTANFHAAVIIAPEARWGIVVLMNANNMLAASTLSRIAPTVMNLLLGRQPPGARLSFGTLYLIVDVVILLLTAFMFRSIVLLPRWRKRLAERRPLGLPGLLWRVILPIAGDFVLPFILLIFLPAGAGFPLWSVMILLQPDLTYWLLAVALVMLAKGIIRSGLAISGLRMAGKA
ncbi:MAG: serine hydrolase domain-containing protein [Chloroflexota bacterium]